MKQMGKKRSFQIVLVILAYILLLGVCVTVVLSAPYLSHRTFLNNLLEQAVSEYAVTSDLESIELHSLGALVYDKAGKCIDSKLPNYFYYNDNAEDAFSRWPQAALPCVLENNRVLHISFVLPKKVGVIYLGKPIRQGDAVTGGLFLIRDLHDLFPTMISVCAAYTLFFALAIFCLFYTLGKKQKYFQLQNNYVANLSHDLKSPITSIKALAETLHADLVTNEDTRHKYYNTIISEAASLQYTVSGILELSAMQSSQIDISKRTENIFPVLEPIIEKYKMLCYDMMIDFHVSDTFSALSPVHTNAKSIARLLDILLDNAVKFVGTDGNIQLEATSGTKYLTVCVRDNGCGIPPEAQARIFDRFYMGDPSHSGRGSGLGLAIAKEITTALEERLWVESTLGEGSAFFFTIHFK